MKKMILMLILLSANSFGAWQDTDGTLDFKCGNGVNDFVFKAYYDADPQGGLKFSYDVSVFQFPFLGAEIQPVEQKVPGCQKAHMEFSETATGAEIYFECAADGDAGFGTIKADFLNNSINLEISFPEGQPTLMKPIPDGTEMNLSCDFLD